MPPSIRETHLGNGLEVILKEVHTAPVTSTWMWYRVGSRNEAEGHTGLAHWVEHMMFKGSPRFGKGSIMRSVDRLGGYVNAMTSNDFTAYLMTLPSERAELALEIESDRMVGALFDPDEVEAERTVILAEREASENLPRFVLAEEIMSAAFGVHPYHHQAIGWSKDLRVSTRDDLYAFYQRHYMPSNAVLVVVGDLDPDDYLALVEEHFGQIPGGNVVSPEIPQEPCQDGERRVTLRMPGAAPLVRLSYHTPPVCHPDYIPVVVLDSVLSGGKAMFAFGDSQARSARLYRAMVETELASSSGSNYHPSLDPYLLTVGATVRLGREPAEVEQALSSEVARLHSEPVSERELSVAIRQTQAQFAYSSESVTSQALTLGFLEMVDHHQRMDGILGELARVTPDDVMRVAQTYLVRDRQTTGWFLPVGNGQDSLGDEPEAGLWKVPNRGMFAYRPPRPHPISPETVVRRELDNGITVLVQENPASSSVTVEGDLLAGGIYDTNDSAGLASLTASMLRRGTAKHSFQDLNVALDDVGASLGFSAGRDDMGFSGRSLADDLGLMIDLVIECLTEPAFPEQELSKFKGQVLTNLGILEADTGYRAERAFMEALYPAGHPYARPPMGDRRVLGMLSRDSLAEFYRGHYHPRTLVICVVGAVEAERVIGYIEGTLGEWRVEADPPVFSVASAETPPEPVTRRVALPGKSQVDLIWGVVGLARSSPDYYAAMMANLILGRLGMMGRLGESVRDAQGLAYYVGSSLNASRGAHPWDIVAGVHPDNIDRAVDSIRHEVGRLRQEPITDDELADCRSYVTGSLPLHLETNEGIAGFLLAIEEYGLGLDYLERHPGLIHAVTKEDIRRVVQEYLTLDRYVLSMSGTFD